MQFLTISSKGSQRTNRAIVVRSIIWHGLSTLVDQFSTSKPQSHGQGLPLFVQMWPFSTLGGISEDILLDAAWAVNAQWPTPRAKVNCTDAERLRVTSACKAISLTHNHGHSISFPREWQNLETRQLGLAYSGLWVILASTASCKSGRILTSLLSQHRVPCPHSPWSPQLPAYQGTSPSTSLSWRHGGRQNLSKCTGRSQPQLHMANDHHLISLSCLPRLRPGSSHHAPLRMFYYTGTLLRHFHVNSKDLALWHPLKSSLAMMAASPLLVFCGE